MKLLKNFYFLVFLLSFLLPSYLFAADEIDRESKLNSAINIQSKIQDIEKNIEELQGRADDNELQAALSKVKFGLDFNTTVSNFFIDNAIVGKIRTNLNQPNRWAMGLYLNMNAYINDYTKFTGRLSMTKAFGDINWGTPSTIGVLDAGRGYGGGPAIFVERAYIDIFGGDLFAFTIGRLPGTDGPGSNLRNGSARMATYPALLVNALGDGLVFTFKPYTDAAFRMGYSKIYQPLTKDSGHLDNIFGTKEAADANLFFATFETPFLPKQYGRSLIMLSYTALLKYVIPAGAIQSNNLVNKTSNMGDIHYLNLHLESENMFDVGFNWFVSGTYYKGANPKSILLTNAANSLIPINVFNDKSAFSFHLGFRQDFSSFKIGYEYFYGSKYWYAISRVSINDPLNFRNTKGNVHDVYAIYQLDLNQLFRISYTIQQAINESFAAPLNLDSPFLQPSSVNRTTQNIALSYILRF